MHDWTSATYQFTPLEQELFNEMAEEVTEDSGYWNEEELKIDFVGLAFRIARVKTPKKIKVFFFALFDTSSTQQKRLTSGGRRLDPMLCILTKWSKTIVQRSLRIRLIT